MKKIAAASLCLFASMAQADPVVEAYDSAFAAGRVALSMQKQCEASIQKNDLGPCEKAKKAHAVYRTKSKQFIDSVKPADLFMHVTPRQMDDITALNKEIGASLDYVNAYMDAQ